MYIKGALNEASELESELKKSICNFVSNKIRNLSPDIVMEEISNYSSLLSSYVVDHINQDFAMIKNKIIEYEHLTEILKSYGYDDDNIAVDTETLAPKEILAVRVCDNEFKIIRVTLPCGRNSIKVTVCSPEKLSANIGNAVNALKRRILKYYPVSLQVQVKDNFVLATAQSPESESSTYQIPLRWWDYEVSPYAVQHEGVYRIPNNKWNHVVSQLGDAFFDKVTVLPRKNPASCSEALPAKIASGLYSLKSPEDAIELEQQAIKGKSIWCVYMQNDVIHVSLGKRDWGLGHIVTEPTDFEPNYRYALSIREHQT
jgi:hypothetical protein